MNECVPVIFERRELGVRKKSVWEKTDVDERSMSILYYLKG